MSLAYTGAEAARVWRSNVVVAPKLPKVAAPAQSAKASPPPTVRLGDVLVPTQASRFGTFCCPAPPQPRPRRHG